MERASNSKQGTHSQLFDKIQLIFIQFSSLLAKPMILPVCFVIVPFDFSTVKVPTGLVPVLFYVVHRLIRILAKDEVDKPGVDLPLSIFRCTRVSKLLYFVSPFYFSSSMLKRVYHDAVHYKMRWVDLQTRTHLDSVHVLSLYIHGFSRNSPRNLSTITMPEFPRLNFTLLLGLQSMPEETRARI